ncbi:hypothetical protein EVAR_31908_1 [Eumeta japonica]|uniref:Uncharacterized protein n=1 Tax=Eumeta variegata TaxID=151549 RepID=A0A4C1XLK4_EUMVA|nr:hypothetical protein EVAR_31908_1 [Eumeta japonica]
MTGPRFDPPTTKPNQMSWTVKNSLYREYSFDYRIDGTENEDFTKPLKRNAQTHPVVDVKSQIAPAMAENRIAERLSRNEITDAIKTFGSDDLTERTVQFSSAVRIRTQDPSGSEATLLTTEPSPRGFHAKSIHCGYRLLRNGKRSRTPSDSRWSLSPTYNRNSIGVTSNRPLENE